MDCRFTPEEALNAAITRLGSQGKLARACGVSQPSVWRWVHHTREVPAEHVLAIESATGISRHDLRPDIYPREEQTSSTSSAGVGLVEASPSSGPFAGGDAPHSRNPDDPLQGVMA